MGSFCPWESEKGDRGLRLKRATIEVKEGLQEDWKLVNIIYSQKYLKYFKLKLRSDIWWLCVSLDTKYLDEGF